MDVFGADGHDAGGEFGLARGDHRRVQPVRDEIAEQAGAVRIVLAPSKKVFRVKWAVLFHMPEPLFPVDGFRLGIVIEGDIPFALFIVPAIITLTPDQRPDFAGLNELSRFMPSLRRAAL